MKLRSHWNLHVLLALEFMGWLAGLMYFLMEGELLLSFITLVLVLGLFAFVAKLFPPFCSTVQRWLTTAPGAPTTHWYRLRCVLPQPLYVMPGQEITGRLHLVAHKAQSYTIYLTLSGSSLLWLFATCLSCLSSQDCWYFFKNLTCH